ncbi:phage gp6-like head-tail connector protein, partial [Xanthomonas perforans]
DPIETNASITAAVLLIAGHLFRNREAVTDETANQLPLGAHALLWPHRVGLGV